jgi:hypothetical protein
MSASMVKSSNGSALTAFPRRDNLKCSHAINAAQLGATALSLQGQDTQTQNWPIAQLQMLARPDVYLHYIDLL